MYARLGKVTARTVVLVAVLGGAWIAYLIIFAPPKPTVGIRTLSAVSSSATDGVPHPENQNTPRTGEELAHKDKRESPKELHREKSIAKHASANLVTSGSLTINDAAVALLGLTAKQTRELNESVAQFVDRLKSDELSHAYVETTEEGTLQIVVAPFDRTEALTHFGDDLTNKLGPAISDFVITRAKADPTLAVGNAEMRAYVEHGNDGADRDVFVRTVPGKSANLSGKEFGVVNRIKTARLLGQEFNVRTRHLWAAVDRLPKAQGGFKSSATEHSEQAAKSK